MKLMVGEVMEVLIRVQRILQHYQGSKVVDALDDIYLRCCTSEDPGGTYRLAPDMIREDDGVNKIKAPKKDKKEKRKLSTDEDILRLQEELRSISRDEAEAILNLYSVKDLVKFAECIPLSVKKSNKDVIVGQISNHFGFRQLNAMMEQRPNMQR